jgi:hypothetical protein
MQVKSIIFLSFLIAAAFASKDEYTNVIARQEVPGFWNGRNIQPVAYQKTLANKFDRNGRIVGGQETKPNAHPYQVGLLIDIHWWTAMCGGCLLSTRIVMTAAHCVEDSSGLTVVLGAHRLFDSLEPTQVRINVEPSSFIVHPYYDRVMLYNDLALLVLPTFVTFNAHIQPIKLPKDELLRKDFAGEIATVSGWGRFR